MTTIACRSLRGDGGSEHRRDSSRVRRTERHRRVVVTMSFCEGRRRWERERSSVHVVRDESRPQRCAGSQHFWRSAPMRTVVRRPEAGQVVYVGLDIARTKWVFHVRWGGQEQRRVSTPAGLEHLHGVLAPYADASIHLAYEACGFGYAIAWDLAARGIDVTVVPVNTMARPPGPRVKTDRLDARRLATELESGRLKRVRVPTRADHVRRQLSRTYQQPLTDKKRAQARVRSLLQDHGYFGPRPTAGWRAYAQWVVAQPLAPCVRQCVDELIAARTAAAASAQRLKRALRTADE